MRKSAPPVALRRTQADLHRQVPLSRLALLGPLSRLDNSASTDFS